MYKITIQDGPLPKGIGGNRLFNSIAHAARHGWIVRQAHSHYEV